ncbi:MAG: Trk family potassium uptake protein [Clostridia bacterium]|nr:Trk family potassium uptake protein [Clostridia bacterium]MDE7329467.1 Trk family potassium uptake protein [Clostridia bacterium]
MRENVRLGESILTRSKKNKIFKHLTIARLLLLAFFILILIGTLLLMLPFATQSGQSVGFMDALFTATSATCVVGLTVTPTAATFSVFGQIVILLLIQIGGLGFMTITSFFYSMLGKKLTLRIRLSMSEEMSQATGAARLKSLAIKIVILAVGMEIIGVIFLTIGFCISGYSFGKSLWWGLFHSIAAFCNSGFDVVSLTGSSLIDFNGNYLILMTLAILTGVGGLGFIVLVDISEKKRFSKLSLHTKIVILMSLLLIFGGAFLFWIGERKNPDTIGNMPLFTQWVNCYFHSVSCRTAGFASFDTSKMTDLSTTLTMLLMFIGVAPGSTGGGIKVTTLYILFAHVIATLQQKKYFVVDKRAIGSNTLAKAISTLLLAISVLTISTIIILIAENNRPQTDLTFVIFEEISAYSTCGLSLGSSADLSTISKLIIIIDMYLGRIGAFTFFMSFANSRKQISKIKYSEASINV